MPFSWNGSPLVSYGESCCPELGRRQQGPWSVGISIGTTRRLRLVPDVGDCEGMRPLRPGAISSFNGQDATKRFSFLQCVNYFRVINEVRCL